MIERTVNMDFWKLTAWELQVRFVSEARLFLRLLEDAQDSLELQIVKNRVKQLMELLNLRKRIEAN